MSKVKRIKRITFILVILVTIVIDSALIILNAMNTCRFVKTLPWKRLIQSWRKIEHACYVHRVGTSTLTSRPWSSILASTITLRSSSWWRFTNSECQQRNRKSYSWGDGTSSQRSRKKMRITEYKKDPYSLSQKGQLEGLNRLTWALRPKSWTSFPVQ